MLKGLKFKDSGEILFFAAYIIFMIGFMLNSSTYSDIGMVNMLAKGMQLLGCFIAVIKIAIFGIRELLARSFKLNYFGIAFLLCLILSFFFSRSVGIVYFAVFVVAAHGIDFKRIVKVTFWVQLSMLAFVVASSFVGIIEGVNVARGEATRYSLGCSSPNCLMLQIFQLMVLYCYLKKDTIRLKNVLVLLAVSYVFYMITDSRMAFVSIVLVLVASLIFKIKRVQEMLEHYYLYVKNLPVILSALMVALTVFFQPLQLTDINSLFSGRLGLTDEAFYDYGITLFGNEIEWIGQKNASESEETKYNYVDSSYVRILLENGLLVFFMMLYGLALQKKDAYKDKNYFLILLLCVVEIFCFFDSFLIAVAFNTTLFLQKDVLYPLKPKELPVAEAEES